MNFKTFMKRYFALAGMCIGLAVYVKTITLGLFLLSAADDLLVCCGFTLLVIAGWAGVVILIAVIRRLVKEVRSRISELKI